MGREEEEKRRGNSGLHWTLLTLPGVFLSVQIDRKVFRIEVNDGRVLLNTDHTTCNKINMKSQHRLMLPFYDTMKLHYISIIFKLDSLGPTSVASMLVAGSSHWQQETLPSAALEV